MVRFVVLLIGDLDQLDQFGICLGPTKSGKDSHFLLILFLIRRKRQEVDGSNRCFSRYILGVQYVNFLQILGDFIQLLQVVTFLILLNWRSRKSEMEKMGVKGDDLKNLETVISTCSFH